MSEEPNQQGALGSKICSALAHIAEHGHLHAFRASPSETQVLMRQALGEGLIVWIKQFQRYEVTKAGRERLADYGRAMAPSFVRSSKVG